jgi:hypothetical protein
MMYPLLPALKVWMAFDDMYHVCCTSTHWKGTDLLMRIEFAHYSRYDVELREMCQNMVVQ